VELNHSYAPSPDRSSPSAKMGFKDEPKRGGNEMLRLSIETVPLWMPGDGMKGVMKSE